MTLQSNLNTLESAGLIRLAQLEPELTYLFRHALVQDAAYASLLGEDRRRLHRSVGEAIERLYGDRLEGHAATLAYHFHQAGAGDRALRYYVMAGKEALKAFANGEAEINLRRALSLSSPPDKRAWLLYALGEAVYRMSRFADAIAIWRDGIQAYQSLHDLDGIARLYARSARAAWHAGDPPRGLQLCDEGLEAIADAPESAARAFLLHEAGRACHFNGMQTRARSLCEQALAMAEKFGDNIVIADTLTTLGVFADQPVEQALAYLRRAVDLAEAEGLLEIGIRAWHNFGVITSATLGDFPTATKHYERAVEIARQRGNARQEAYSLANLLGVLLPQGRIAEWQQGVHRVEELSEKLAAVDAVHSELEVMRIQVAWLDDRADEALDRARALHESARRQGDLQMTQNSAATVAGLHLARHRFGEPADLGEAVEAMQEVIAIADRGIGEKAGNYYTLAGIYAASGQMERAREVIALAEAERDKPSSIWDEFHRRSTEAEIAMLEKRWVDALSNYETMAAEYARLGFRSSWAEALVRWAEALRRQGRYVDLKRAQALLREALAAFGELGNRRGARQAEEMLSAVRADIMAQAAAHELAAAELAAAGRIQASFLPETIPALPGWGISAMLKAARETSGDFYDFIRLPDGKLGLLIADVADKGAGAAMFMAMCRSTLRNSIESNPEEPHAALRLANERILGETHADMFVTVFLAVLDPATGGLCYCNAGHNPPLVQGSAGTIEMLDRTGMALGIMADGNWTPAETALKPGDVLLLYTDGVTEAQNSLNELFGEDRLLTVLQATGAGTTRDVQTALVDAVSAFVGDAPQSDDMTCIIVKREGA